MFGRKGEGIGVDAEDRVPNGSRLGLIFLSFISFDAGGAARTLGFDLDIPSPCSTWLWCRLIMNRTAIAGESLSGDERAVDSELRRR